MPRQFERYRFRDGVTPLDEGTFNRVLADLDLRLANLEEVRIEWDAALTLIADQGLARVASAMSGPLASLGGEVEDLRAIIAAAQQEGVLLDGPDTVSDTNIGDRTLSDATPPASDSGGLTALLGGLANRLKAVTGGATWRATPPTTLTALAAAFTAATSHIANKSNPHQTTATSLGAAAVGGSAAQVFQVGAATADAHALNRATGDGRYLKLAGGTLSGAVTLAAGASLGAPLAAGNQALAGVKTLGFHAEYDNGSSGASKTITLANGGRQKLAISQSSPTLTISTTGAAVGEYVLRLVNGGSWSVSWSGLSSSRWLGASSTPSIRSGSGAETYVFFYWDGNSLTQRMEKVGSSY